MSLKVLGRNIDNTDLTNSNTESPATMELDKKDDDVVYLWGTPTGKYNQVSHGATSLDAKDLADQARVFTMKLNSPITIPDNRIMYIHRTCSDNPKNNWYQVYIIEERSDNVYLGYFI
jgi:hypothetical protein